MLHGLICHFYLIFGLLINKKCDLSEVDKAMFQVVARHCELIFCLLTQQKCFMDEVDKAMFQVAEVIF